MSTPEFTPRPVPGKPGWFRGPVIDWQAGKEVAARMRSFPATSRFQVLVGHLEEDHGHCVYLTPPIGVRALVEGFRVGERAALSFGFDAAEMVERVATRLEAIEKICPLVVTFADPAGLHAEFTRKLTKTTAAKIDRLFPMDDVMQEGLEGYISDWSGEGPLLVPRLVKEQSIQFWWD
jgi:hypothetical protein